MDSAESLLTMHRVHVMGQLTVHALDSVRLSPTARANLQLPFPLITVLLFACLTFLFRLP